MLEETVGTISLFAVLKMDELTDKWTVVLSAHDIEGSKRSETFFKLRDLLLQHLNETERLRIARIGLFNTTEHLIELMLEKYRSGDYINRDEKINGNLIHEGYILTSHKATDNKKTE